MRINNEAVSIYEIDVELSWYRLGHQFAELNAEDQYQFLFGMLDSIREWEAPIKNLYQLQAISDEFNKHNETLKPELAKWLDDLSDRMKS